jgi:ergothioneine biosynthesis protein EgtB
MTPAATPHALNQPHPQAAAHSPAARLLARFQAIRAASLALAAPLSPEDMMVQSCSEASPVKWHLAHTSWFFETFVLAEFLPAYKPFHPDFHWLFNSYYNSLGEIPEKKLRASFSRPALIDILAYRAHVDAAIARLLGAAPEYPANAEAARRIRLGLEHEQQHQELIATDIKHALFTNPLHPAYLAPSVIPPSEAIAPPISWIDFPAGLTQIGFEPGAPELDSQAWESEFAFDNESPRHTVYLAPFALASRLVTCAEYLAFMDDNGYTRPELWLSEGWATMRDAGWQAPLYWQRTPANHSGWRIYTLHGWQPLDDLSETPVCHLSFFEADAFARWAARDTPGARLPTEFEWEHAASVTILGASDLASETWAEATQNSQAAPSNLLESAALHPTPASSIPGLQQLFGDVWEWTSSGYTGYPGYRPLPGALGEYNGKFMSSQVILRGGSCVTPATHIRATYRNFFQPATRWQFSGLRLAKDAPK